MKSQPSPPAAPNPTQVAGAQTGSNINTALAQALLGNINQISPYGTTQFTQTGSTNIPTGNGNQTVAVPQFTEQTTLNPAAQQVYNAQVGTAGTLANQAKGIAGGLDLQPLQFQGPNQDVINAGPQFLDQASANAAYNQAAQWLDPQFQQQQTLLTDQLRSQGIPTGSDAYNNAMTQFDNSKNQAYNAAANSAIQSGVANASTLFGMANAGQNTLTQEQLTAQNQPLNLISTMLGYGNQLPTQAGTQAVQPGVASTDVTGAYGLQNSALQSLYQNQANMYGQNLGGIAGLGGTALMAAALGGWLQ